MKNRNLIIMSGVFALLLVYVLFTQTGEKGFNTVKLPDFKPAAVEDLTKIELKQGEQSVVFERENEKWIISSPIKFAADKSKMDALTRSISEMRLTDKISENPESVAEFGFADESARHIIMTDKKNNVLECSLGSINSSGTHTFVRLKNDISIYQIMGNMNYHFDRKAEDWRSTQIFDFSRDTVREIIIEQKGKAKLIIAKTEEAEENIIDESGNTPAALKTKAVWKSSLSDKTFNEAKINQLLNAVSRLTGSNIIDQPSLAKDSVGSITVNTWDNSYILNIISFNHEKKMYLVKSNKSDVHYEIPEYQGQSFLKTVNDFN